MLRRWFGFALHRQLFESLLFGFRKRIVAAGETHKSAGRHLLLEGEFECSLGKLEATFPGGQVVLHLCRCNTSSVAVPRGPEVFDGVSDHATHLQRGGVRTVGARGGRSGRGVREKRLVEAHPLGRITIAGIALIVHLDHDFGIHKQVQFRLYFGFGQPMPPVEHVTNALEVGSCLPLSQLVDRLQDDLLVLGRSHS